MFQDNAAIYFNKAETVFTVEQLARGESRSNNFSDNSITMNDHNLVPLFVEEQLKRRETCVNVLSYDSRTNSNSIESLFIAAQHSSDE